MTASNITLFRSANVEFSSIRHDSQSTRKVKKLTLGISIENKNKRSGIIQIEFLKNFASIKNVFSSLKTNKK